MIRGFDMLYVYCMWSIFCINGIYGKFDRKVRLSNKLVIICLYMNKDLIDLTKFEFINFSSLLMFFSVNKVNKE